MGSVNEKRRYNVKWSLVGSPYPESSLDIYGNGTRHQTGQKIPRAHYNDAIMGAIASQITSLTIVYSTFYSGADQRKHQSSASLAFVRGIHRTPGYSPHKGPVTRKMFPFDDVIMPQVICSQYHFDDAAVCPQNQQISNISKHSSIVLAWAEHGNAYRVPKNRLQGRTILRRWSDLLAPPDIFSGAYQMPSRPSSVWAPVRRQPIFQIEKPPSGSIRSFRCLLWVCTTILAQKV